MCHTCQNYKEYKRDILHIQILTYATFMASFILSSLSFSLSHFSIYPISLILYFHLSVPLDRIWRYSTRLQGAVFKPQTCTFPLLTVISKDWSSSDPLLRFGPLNVHSCD